MKIVKIGVGAWIERWEVHDDFLPGLNHTLAVQLEALELDWVFVRIHDPKPKLSPRLHDEIGWIEASVLEPDDGEGVLVSASRCSKA